MIKRIFIIPKLVATGWNAPKEVTAAWNTYWKNVAATGLGGEVLWDGAASAELELCTRQAREFLPADLPVVDLGCGNGRFARALASLFPRVVGIDLADSAIARAEAESAGVSNVSFRAMDVTRLDAAAAIRQTMGGDANVFVRGVLHCLSHDQRRSFIANVSEILGSRGIFFWVETAYPGSSLGFLESLGATPRFLPIPVQRCIEFGLPVPKRFGARELKRYFPGDSWRCLHHGEALIHGVAMRKGAAPETMPAYFAVVKPVSSPQGR